MVPLLPKSGQEPRSDSKDLRVAARPSACSANCECFPEGRQTGLRHIAKQKSIMCSPDQIWLLWEPGSAVAACSISIGRGYGSTMLTRLLFRSWILCLNSAEVSRSLPFSSCFPHSPLGSYSISKSPSIEIPSSRLTAITSSLPLERSSPNLVTG